MLTPEDNELLTRVGPGAPMGNVLRRFWLPFALAQELPGPDCDPIRVRLLGEDLVAFRDSSGRPGLVAANCPHRGASLFFGRNEENGLRCVYHGWKFDVSGQCVDMPNEPAESNFKNKVRARAYPCVDRGGVIWTYLGPEGSQMDLPELEWTHVADNQRYVSKRIQFCNYLQNVEGEVDSSHVSFLHSRAVTSGNEPASAKGSLSAYMASSKAPRFFVNPTEYGLLIGARREAGDEGYYWRITQFLMPSYTMIPAGLGDAISFTAAVPRDDVSMMGFTVTWHPDRPLTPEEVAGIESWTGVHTEVDPKTFTPLRNIDNEYLLDRAFQRNGSYTGIRGIREEDLAVQEGMGPIFDRSGEHLGSADLAVIAMRKRLLDAVAALENGQVPYEAQHPNAYHVRSAVLVLPAEIDWQQGSAEAVKARV